MIKVKVHGKEYECDTYWRGKKGLTLYDSNGNPVASFGGISSFAGCEVDGIPMEDIPEAATEKSCRTIYQIKKQRRNTWKTRKP
jgi:hypothetical protein